jgi:hypothetical protein
MVVGKVSLIFHFVLHISYYDMQVLVFFIGVKYGMEWKYLGP